jgi:4-alpha-glucanotransferase
MTQLHRAWQGFVQAASEVDRLAFAHYCDQQSNWLDDYALFMALDQRHNPPGQAFRSWCDWDIALAQRQPRALAVARERNHDEIAFWQFVQWSFDVQWQALRTYARSRGVSVVGDMPIFVAHHSADCWARPDLYQLDQRGQPEVVAGVPPDFFSPTGQRWGNPLYRWEIFEQEGFAWWIARIKRQLALVDVLRIDHFRGFAGYWEIPSTCPTAQTGRWVTAPGKALFTAIKEALGTIPIIAEDLGLITPDVIELRDAFSLPGMRIVQFAFSDSPKNNFLPHNYTPNTVAYTGTHDNDTVRGWWASATERELAYARIYLGCEEAQSHWAMIRAAMASTAMTVVFPLQDVLGLDGQHRMNTPGVLGGWTWRFSEDWLSQDSARTLSMLSAAFDRAGIEHLPLPAYPIDRPHP